MKKTILIMMGICFLAGLSQGQDAAADLVPQDPKAQGILDKLTEKSKTYKSFSANFTYRLQNKDQGVDESQSGSLKSMGEKFCVNLGGQTLINDGKAMYTIIEEVELQINCLPEEDDPANMFNPNNLLTMYEDGFKYKYEESITINGKKADVINLFPKDPRDKPYHTIILTVLSAELQIHALQILNKDGNIFTYTIKDFKPNAGVAAEDFEIDPDDFEDVIDLRDDC